MATGAAVREHPASAVQTGIWLACPRGVPAGYVICEVVRCRDLVPAALERAVVRLAERHELLRASYHAIDGRLHERVADRVDAPLRVLDRRDASQPAEALRACAQRELERVYDLATAPLWRCAAVLLAGGDDAIVLGCHHLVVDGASMRLLLDELARLYDAERAGRAVELPRPAASYREIAARGARGSERAEAWWRERLRDREPPSELPADRPRRARRAGGALARTRLEAPLAQRIAALAVARDATPFAVLATLVVALLHRCTGDRDIALGTVVSARVRRDAALVVGPLISTVPVCVRLDPERGLAACVDATRAAIADSLRHVAAPFAVLGRDLGSSDGLRNPLFDVMVTLDEPGAAPPAPFAGVDAHALLESRVARYDLTLAFAPGAGGIDVLAEYDTALFDGARIERMLAHLATLARSAVEDPQLAIARLRILPDDEQRLVIRRFASGGALARPPAEADLVASFDRVALAQPGAAAVAGPAGLTYAELRDGSLALALELAARGIGRGDIVATRGAATAGTIATWLAVLRTGAAYLALDPDWPEPRVRDLVERSGAALVLEPDGVDGLATAPADHAAGPPPPGPDAPAYAIFTSGSSGAPKLVVVAHGSVVNLACAHAEALGLGPGARVSLLSSVGFDASVMELWPALLSGATTVPLSRDERLDPDRLAHALARDAVTHAFVATALLPLVLERTLPPSLTVMTGGEALVLDALPDGGPTLFNAYGPTECTVAATWTEVTADMVPGAIPIGRPIPNVRVDLLDGALQPVPIGVDGEICIGGAGVALRVDGAGGAFCANPLDGGRPTYRTGDIGRWRADGLVEFRGRRDDQVQVRGQRVEPAEIEAHLVSQPEIARAAVVARGSGAGARLVAWVVAAHDGLDARAVRARLRRELPAHLVPSHIECVDALPVTPGGKVDRAALRARSPSRAPLGPPADDRLTGVVASAWSETLGAQVGGDTPLFEAGATSLSAMIVAARLTQTLGFDVSVQTVLSSSTAAACAATLRSPAAGVVPSRAVTADPARTSWPMTPTQVQILAIERRLPATSLSHLTRRFWVRGGAGAIERACAQIVARHPILASRMDLDAKEMVRIDAPVPVRRLALVDSPADAVERDVALLARTPFALERQAPWRVDVVACGGDELVQICIHHVAGDAQSLRIVEDALIRGLEPRPEATPHFGDVALQLSEHPRRGALHAAVEHWRAVLRSPLDPLASLGPGDERAGPFDTRESRRRLGADGARAVLRAGGRAGASRFVVAASALALALHRTLDVGDVRIATNVSTRTSLAMHEMVGPFVNTAVVRVGVASEAPFGALVADVGREVRTALAHRDVPLESVLAALRRDGPLDLTSAAPAMLLVDDGLGDRPADARVRPATYEDEHAGVAVTASDLVFGMRCSEADVVLSLVHRERSCAPKRATELLAAWADALLDAPAALALSAAR